MIRLRPEGHAIRTRRRALLDDLHRLVTQDRRFHGVVAVEAGGSWGRGLDDDLSDIDLFCYVDSAELDRYLAGKAFDLLHRLGEVRRERGPRFTEQLGWGCTVHYPATGVVQAFFRGDSEMAAGYLQSPPGEVLFDRDGRLSGILRSARAVPVPRCELTDAALSEVYFRLFDVSKELARGHDWQARKYFREILEQALTLARLAVDAEPSGRYYRHSGRGMEHDLPADLRDTIQDLDRECATDLGPSLISRTICLVSSLEERVNSDVPHPVDWPAIHREVVARLGG